MLSDLIDEKASLSPEMALRIEKAFGLDRVTMLRMQAWYDGAAMRERADEMTCSVTGACDVRRYAHKLTVLEIQYPRPIPKVCDFKAYS